MTVIGSPVWEVEQPGVCEGQKHKAEVKVCVCVWGCLRVRVCE